ncbi:Peptidase T, partial [Dissostichus eleginoides]
AAALVGRAAAVKVRLISPPIKPGLCMEQLSTAISKACQDYQHFNFHTTPETCTDAAGSAAATFYHKDIYFLAPKNMLQLSCLRLPSEYQQPISICHCCQAHNATEEPR